jgi:hypothetical protein
MLRVLLMRRPNGANGRVVYRLSSRSFRGCGLFVGASLVCGIAFGFVAFPHFTQPLVRRTYCLASAPLSVIWTLPGLLMLIFHCFLF